MNGILKSMIFVFVISAASAAHARDGDSAIYRAINSPEETVFMAPGLRTFQKSSGRLICEKRVKIHHWNLTDYSCYLGAVGNDIDELETYEKLSVQEKSTVGPDGGIRYSKSVGDLLCIKSQTQKIPRVSCRLR